MSDPADLAAPVEQRQRDDALANQAALNAAHETPFEIDGKRVCLDCYDPIPARRLKACPHAVRCVECQNDHDRRAQRGIS